MFKKTIRIMTRTGDKGTTALADGNRVQKSGKRIDAIGNVDELNSIIGLLLTENLPETMQEELAHIQNELFDIGAELAGAQVLHSLNETQIKRLETQVEKYDVNLLPLQGFILPGGSRAGAFLHYARSVCRRVERSIFALVEEENIQESIGVYLNRLSDVLFIYARAANRENNKPETLWKKNRKSITE